METFCKIKDNIKNYNSKSDFLDNYDNYDIIDNEQEDEGNNSSLDEKDHSQSSECSEEDNDNIYISSNIEWEVYNKYEEYDTNLYKDWIHNFIRIDN